MDLPAFEAGSRHYQELALTPERQVLNVDAYLNGKTSTEDNITHYGKPDVDEDAAVVPAGDFLAEPDASMYYVSIDPRGELAWEGNTFGYGGVSAHFLEVLTDQAGNAYKDFLRRKRISYIIAGGEQIEYGLMLSKLHGARHQAAHGGRRRSYQLVLPAKRPPGRGLHGAGSDRQRRPERPAFLYRP